MTEQLNIISIFCTISLNIADISEKNDQEQRFLKNHINQLFDIAFRHIGQTNRIILITDKGAKIAYSGPPEDAMLLARDIVNVISLANKKGSTTLSAYIGVHLEPVHLISDFNQHANIIANAISTAEQVMTQAKPNEILVSRSYYDNVPASTQATSILWREFPDHNETLESKDLADTTLEDQDTLIQSLPIPVEQPLTMTDSSQLPEELELIKRNSWKKIAFASVFTLITVFSIAHLSDAPNESRLSTKAPPSSNLRLQKVEASQKSNTTEQSLDVEKSELPQEESIKPTEKPVKQQPKSKPDAANTKTNIKQLLNWETLKKSIKQGQKKECTQSERAMNQCRE